MRIFIDANVIISVLLHEYPLFEYSSRILSLADNPKFTLYTSPVCLAIAFYFLEKKTGSSQIAKKKISILTKKLMIAGINAEEIQLSLANKQIHDFKDGMEYYAALQHKCKIIVTEDSGDFYYSEIPVLPCEQFWRNMFFNSWLSFLSPFHFQNKYYFRYLSLSLNSLGFENHFTFWRWQIGYGMY